MARLPQALIVLVTVLATFVSSSPTPPRKRDSPPSATFVYNEDKNWNLTFAITGVKSNGDIYFHLEAPSSHPWVAVGTGEEMKGSAMFVVYAGQDKKGVTLSPRVSDGEVEPSYDPRLSCTLITSTNTLNGVINYNNTNLLVANARCKDIVNFTASRQGKLDFNNVKQNFIFAIGPDEYDLHSDSKSADLRRHSAYGVFQLDMASATVDTYDNATVPWSVGPWTNNKAKLLEQKSDHQWIGAAHAVLMCGGFVVLFPLGVIVLRLLHNVKGHAIVQAIGTGLGVVGGAVGLKLGTYYNHSKTPTSSHQVIGFAVILLCIVQLSLGVSHHRLFLRHRQPTILGKIHRFAGPGIIVLGITNGFMGFEFAYQSEHNVAYGIFVGIAGSLVVGALVWRRLADRRKRARLPGEGYEGFAMVSKDPVVTAYGGVHDSRSEVHLGEVYNQGREEVPRPMV